MPPKVISLRKIFYNRKYKRDFMKLLPYVRRTDEESTKDLNKSIFDSFHLPLDVNYKTVNEASNCEIKIDENFFTIDPTQTKCYFNDCKTDDRLKEINIYKNKWCNKVERDSKSMEFFNRARKDIRRHGGEYKVFENQSLLRECEYFLRTNGFEYDDSAFTKNNEYSFYFHLNYLPKPINIPKGLLTTFAVDESNSVSMRFNNKPFKYFVNSDIDEKKVALYVLLQCNLIIVQYNSDCYHLNCNNDNNNNDNKNNNNVDEIEEVLGSNPTSAV